MIPEQLVAELKKIKRSSEKLKINLELWKDGNNL